MYKHSQTNKLLYHTITAPKIIFISEEHGENLSSFISALHKLCKAHNNIIIDFTNTSKIYASGGLLMYAEIRNCHNTYKCRIRCSPPKNNKVSQVFKQIGLYEFLKKRITVTTTAHDVVQWRFATGKNVDGSKYESILSQYDGKIATSLSSGLFVGITEAMTNCCHHAYIAARESWPTNTDQESWWMFSQEKDNILSVVFCDLGVGIPNTLPQSHPSWWDTITRLFHDSNITDGQIISQAVQLSKTRTQLSHRGKGLSQLSRFIEEHPGSKIIIFSNRGGYVASHGKNGIHFDSRNSINGTLIQWTIPLT